MSTITIKQDTLDSILTRLAALETDNDRLRTSMHNFNADRNVTDAGTVLRIKELEDDVRKMRWEMQEQMAQLVKNH